jgi:hypothetical protein
MARRKGWDNLSDSYRKRLQRSGITKSKYNSGRPLAKARGHTSRARETQIRQVDKFIERYQSTYEFLSEDYDELREELRRMRPGETKRALEQQREAQKLYDSGEIIKARRIWEKRDKRLPDWMFYYHGAWGGGS